MEEVMNWRNDPHTCWAISAIVSYVHLKNFRCLQGYLNPWPLWCQCSALMNGAMKPLRCEQVNLLGSCVPVKGMISETNVCDVWLKDEMKKWSSHLLDNLSYCLMSTWKLSGVFNWIQTQDLCDAVEEVININIRALIIILCGLEVW